MLLVVLEADSCRNRRFNRQKSTSQLFYEAELYLLVVLVVRGNEVPDVFVLFIAVHAVGKGGRFGGEGRHLEWVVLALALRATSILALSCCSS